MLLSDRNYVQKYCKLFKENLIRYTKLKIRRLWLAVGYIITKARGTEGSVENEIS